MTERREADVVVVGAGMAGLVGALRAAEAGADVLVIEKAPRPGGSMYVSNGGIWTFDSVEAVREAIPDGNPDLQRLVVEGLEDGLDWLEGHGMDLDPIPYGVPRGRSIDPEPFTEAMVAAVEERGGEVLLETPMTDLRGEGGRVVGVTADAGNRIAVDAESVLLATGGFQGNERLVEQYITDATENLYLRSNPWSTGDGLLAAQRAGAKTSKGFDTFNAQNIAAPPAEFTTEELIEVTQYYGSLVVALDQNGERFTDESESHPTGVTIAQDAAQKAGGRAYYVLDSDLYEREIFTGHTIGELVEAAAEYGGPVARAESLRELGEALSAWGVDGDRAVRTLLAYNRAIRNGRADALDPPREENRIPVDTPPFHAVAVQPGIVFSMGGIAVDTDMRVLSRAGTNSGFDPAPADPEERLAAPIEGLYAAGADVGNVHHRGYMGGLAVALVTGRIAGERAAAYAKP